MEHTSHSQVSATQAFDETVVGTTEYIIVTFKYGGNWVTVKNQSRQRYVGGRQKSVQFERYNVNLSLLRAKVEELCSWEQGYYFALHIHIPNTSPKEYLLLSYDGEHNEVDLLLQAWRFPRAEVVVSTPHDYDTFRDEGSSTAAAATCLNETSHSNDAGSSEHLNVIVDDTFLVGSKFSNAQAFKHALRTEAIKQNCAIKITSSDRTRVLAACSHSGCSWRIRATLCTDDITFEVRKVGGSHSCPGINRAGNKLATTDWIAGEIQDIIKQQPCMPPKDIRGRLEASHGLSLSYMKLWRSRERARAAVHGAVEENYNFVPSLHAELCRRNPGSRVTYMTDSPGNNFKRFYVSFKVSIDGFLAGCRYLVGLDACHLKSKYLGVLLAANSLDGNNGLYNLAYAVVEGESKSTWKWFLENLISEEIKNDSNTNNMSESFNSWIAEARRKPVVDLIDYVRGMLMEQRYNRKSTSHSWRSDLVPFAEDYIREVTVRRDPFMLRQATAFRCDVEGTHCRHEVDTQHSTCTCRYWQVTGLPCIHAVAFILSKQQPVWRNYVSRHYHVQSYRMAYEGAICTMPSKEQWEVIDIADVQVPIVQRPRGRPRSKRFKSFLEKPKGKSSNLHRCGRCRLWGHHQSTCKNPLPDETGQPIHAIYEGSEEDDVGDYDSSFEHFDA